MKEPRVTEPEIIDVLLGDADPVLEARVRQAVRQNLTVAAQYAKWAELIPAVKTSVAPVKAMRERVKQGVMGRLHEQKDEAPAATRPEIRIPQEILIGRRWRWQDLLGRRGWAMLPALFMIAPEETIYGGPLSDISWRLRDAWENRKWKVAIPASALAVGLLFAVVYLALAAFQWNTRTMVTGEVSGNVLAYRLEKAAGDAQPVPLRAGERIRIPARIVVAAGAQVDFRLPDKSILRIADPVDVSIESARRVRQASGTASYRVAKSLFRDNFTVLIPQGTVEDLGTEFKVALNDKRRAVVNVTAGRVRVMPESGQSVEAVAGERAIMSAQAAAVEPIPRHRDLADERAKFRTKLLKREAAPGGQKVGPAPKGYQEIRYSSGKLKLKGWVTEDPRDGTKHPAVVYLHDGAGLGKEDWAQAEALRKAGYVVLAPLARGEGGNPGFFECYYGEVDDAVAAGNFVSGRPYVDPAHVFLAGRGTGGTLAILTAMVPSPFAAAVAIGGLTDAGLYYRGWSAERVPFDTSNPAEGLLRTAKAFPESIRCPLHLIIGEQERALMGMARELAREADKRGKACKVWTVKGKGAGALAEATAQSGKIFGELTGGNDQAATLQISYKPKKMMLTAGSNLFALVQPQSIALSADEAPVQLKKAPPFTSAKPLLGVLKMRLEDRVVEAVVACDQKLNGKWRIYFDSNLNGDLTDDPSFTEGEDFLAGQFFEVGLLDRNNALWLRRPVKIDLNATSGSVGVVEDRLEFINRTYYAGEVTIKGGETGVGKGKKPMFLLLDADSDGDYFDADGSLGVWADGGGKEDSYEVASLAPIGSPTLHAGYQWNLARDLGGGFQLTGNKIDMLNKKRLLTGEPLPSLEVNTITGEKVKLAPAKGQYLLIYVWSTWASPELPDSPANIQEMYGKLKDRGLAMVGISVDYRRQDLLAYLKENTIKWPQVYNGPNLWSGVAAELGVEASPYTILVDPRGMVVSLGSNADELFSLLDDALPKAGIEKAEKE